jgi:hypothetical protein
MLFFVSAVVSHNQFHHQRIQYQVALLEPVNDLHNCDFFGNFVPFFVKKPRFSTTKPTFFS